MTTPSCKHCLLSNHLERCSAMPPYAKVQQKMAPTEHLPTPTISNPWHVQARCMTCSNAAAQDVHSTANPSAMQLITLHTKRLTERVCPFVVERPGSCSRLGFLTCYANDAAAAARCSSASCPCLDSAAAAAAAPATYTIRGSGPATCSNTSRQAAAGQTVVDKQTAFNLQVGDQSNR